ncbi:hypothetical protein [Dickeya zeae]|nr:hypothetical protein [Dickeya zeae]
MSSVNIGYRENTMKNQHEIIGAAVERVINCHGIVNRDTIAQEIMRDFIRISRANASVDERKLYEKAMVFVSPGRLE